MQEYTVINSIKCCGQIQQHHENSLSIVHRLHNVTFDSQQGCLCAVTSLLCCLKFTMQFIIINIMIHESKQFSQLFLKEKPYLTLAYSFSNYLNLNLAFSVRVWPPHSSIRENSENALILFGFIVACNLRKSRLNGTLFHC